MNRPKCEKFLQSFSSISSELLDNFEDKDGPLFFQYAISQFNFCFGMPLETNKRYIDLYLTKKLYPQYDLSNDTLLYGELCPGCSRKSGEHVKEWFKSTADYNKLIDGNCSSIALDESSSVVKWCNKCWKEKDEKCNKCFQQSKAALEGICTIQKYTPTSWQSYDIFMTMFTNLIVNVEQESQPLRQLVQEAAENNQLNILSLWRFLNRPLLMKHYEKYWPETDLAKEVAEVKDSLSKLTDDEQNEIYQTLLSPKIHGNYLEEYVLVPFCSFGSELLKKCDLFERQENFYRKDQVCYTFNKNGNYTGDSLNKMNGLNFAVNFRLPTGLKMVLQGFEPSKPKIIVHSFNEIPDENNFPATTQEISEVNPTSVPKIGPMVVSVRASITNVTSNFASMAESRRNCYLNMGSNKAHHSRNKCRMQEALKQAKSNCNCIPWFIKGNNGSVCDPIGLSCFDNFTESYLKSNTEGVCQDECVSTAYELSVGEILALSNLENSFGEEWKMFFSKDNPMYYTSENGPKYGMVHVNFIHKETTVIMKDAKVTFADMLGSIGGTLGVFIGLSFVGLLDFFIWIWDWVKEMWYVKTSKKTKYHSKLMI